LKAEEPNLITYFKKPLQWGGGLPFLFGITEPIMMNRIKSKKREKTKG
jgi:hypothetical protein